MYCLEVVQLKVFFLKLWFRSLEVVSLSRICGLAFSPTPNLSVEEDEEEQAAMSNMAIDIDYLE